MTTRQERRGERREKIVITEMSEARDTAGLLASPGTKRSVSYTETEDHLQFSTEAPSPKLYRAGLSTVRTSALLIPVSIRE